MMYRKHLQSLSKEEQEFIKLERFMNPITGQRKKKVSSDKIKKMWLEVQKMSNENTETQRHLNKVKMSYYLTNIADYITSDKASTGRKKKKIKVHPGESFRSSELGSSFNVLP